jgi:TfoX/Sxy family transcriptional regulator of competence genes
MTRTTLDADALFDEISRTFLRSPNVTTAKMFGGSALKVKNKVFACFYKGKLVLKLPSERVDELVSAGGAVHFDSGTGRPAKEWVAIDPSRGKEWRVLAKDAQKFVASSR